MSALYLLRFWGLNAEPFYEKYKGEAKCFAEEKEQVFCMWFDSASERNGMLRALESKVTPSPVTALHSGPGVDKETVAVMTLRYRKKDYVVRHGFGYGYEADLAEYYIRSGNGACDCNRCHYIQEVKPNFPDLEKCGDKIELIDLDIENGDTVRDRRPDEPPPVVIEFTGTFQIVGKLRRSFVLRND